MKHPNPECQRKQEEILKNLPQKEREMQARSFRFANAAYIYHQEAGKELSEEKLKVYYEEWLHGLPAHIATTMKEKGTDYCRNAMPFTRYVNERNDRGFRDWMKEHLSEEDYRYYIEECR